MEDENGSKEKERDAVATLEVYAGGYDGLGRILAKRTLACSELLGGGQWQWFALETKWPGPPSQMETRILWQGGKTLKLDRVVLFEKRRKERR